MNGVQIRIRGKVQGVGFRPFVWQLAQSQHAAATYVTTVTAYWCACWAMRRRFSPR